MVLVNFLRIVSECFTFGIYLYPLFSDPVEDVDGIKPAFVGSTTTEDNNSIVFSIIAHGAV